MADIIFRYQEMKNVVEEIKNIATKYKNAATTFETDFENAISAWEGESKDAMQKYIQGPVKEYTQETIPKLLNALADLLASNAEQMKNADKQIAGSIPKTL